MHATMQLTLRDREGRCVASRRVANSVMQGGAQLVAELFAGRGSPITHMAVGASGEPTPDTFNVAALAPSADGDAGPLAGDLDVALGSFDIVPDTGRRLMLVKVRATLPPAAAVGLIREAGLVARTAAATILYNRVTFRELVKNDDHELTMFWEVAFPYGDLHWTM